MGEQRKYEVEYKEQAVKLAHEIGPAKAARELGISSNTMYGWMRAEREGRINVGRGNRSPEVGLDLAEEIAALRKQNRELAREIRRLREENEFLEEASAFFAANRRKSAKTSE